MSAFIVSTAHINTLVSTYIAANPEAKEIANDIANVLMGENYKSVNYRYSEDDAAEIDFFQTVKPVSPLQFLMLANCWDYQACEMPDFKTSLAKQTMDSMIECVCDDMITPFFTLRDIESTDAYDDSEYTIMDRSDIDDKKMESNMVEITARAESAKMGLELKAEYYGFEAKQIKESIEIIKDVRSLLKSGATNRIIPHNGYSQEDINVIINFVNTTCITPNVGPLTAIMLLQKLNTDRDRR